MDFFLSGANICMGNTIEKRNVLVSGGVVKEISTETANHKDIRVLHCDNMYIFPGFTDVHVHLREPGFSYKETIKTGTEAAAAGGYTAVCAMPNVNPVPSTFPALLQQLEQIQKQAVISVYPYGSITVDQKGEKLSELAEMADKVVAFSDDGRGVQNADMMRCAMQKARALNKIIAAHCEVNALLNGGYIHKGKYAAEHGHVGICSESEWEQIKRDIALAKETGCAYHVCHISTKESVELIRRAKAEGVDITCETAPHYLVLDDADLQENGRFKMNPPLRDKSDREALILGLQDGTIDMIATDHAPHSAEEKGRGLAKSAMGVVGLETAFPVLYTHLVKTGIITLQKLVQLMHDNPNKRFKIKQPFAVGEKANFTVYDLNEAYTVDPSKFKSKGKSTPFEGDTVYGVCRMTVADGKIVYER